MAYKSQEKIPVCFSLSGPCFTSAQPQPLLGEGKNNPTTCPTELKHSELAATGSDLASEAGKIITCHVVNNFSRIYLIITLAAFVFSFLVVHLEIVEWVLAWQQLVLCCCLEFPGPLIHRVAHAINAVGEHDTNRNKTSLTSSSDSVPSLSP